MCVAHGGAAGALGTLGRGCPCPGSAAARRTPAPSCDGEVAAAAAAAVGLCSPLSSTIVSSSCFSSLESSHFGGAQFGAATPHTLCALLPFGFLCSAPRIVDVANDTIAPDANVNVDSQLDRAAARSALKNYVLLPVLAIDATLRNPLCVAHVLKSSG